MGLWNMKEVLSFWSQKESYVSNGWYFNAEDWLNKTNKLKMKCKDKHDFNQAIQISLSTWCHNYKSFINEIWNKYIKYYMVQINTNVRVSQKDLITW